MREVEVYAGRKVGKVRFFLRDDGGKISLECVCSRHRGRLAYFFAYGNWRVLPLLRMRDQLVSSFINRALRSVPESSCGAPGDPYFADSYPALWDFLTVTRFEVDGKTETRQVATLSIFTQDAMWKAFLNERESRRCLCVAAPTFTALWEALEATLTSDNVPWRAMNSDGSTARQKPPRKGP